MPQRWCRDQDPACDRDPALGACAIEVALCLNLLAPDLPACSPTGIRSLDPLWPRALPGDRTSERARNAAALEQAVATLSLPLAASQTGRCTDPFLVHLRRGQLPSAATQLALRGQDGRGDAFHSRLRLVCLDRRRRG